MNWLDQAAGTSPVRPSDLFDHRMIRHQRRSAEAHSPLRRGEAKGVECNDGDDTLVLESVVGRLQHVVLCSKYYLKRLSGNLKTTEAPRESDREGERLRNERDFATARLSGTSDCGRFRPGRRVLRPPGAIKTGRCSWVGRRSRRRRLLARTRILRSAITDHRRLANAKRVMRSNMMAG